MANKKWTIERYMTEIMLDVLPSEAHEKLSFRELVIISCAELDIGLSEMISKKLCGDDAEVVGFLGADEDGRAPVGSFGAKIQLAYLLGLLSEEELLFLRSIKKLRNYLAHRVRCDWKNARFQTSLQNYFGAVVRLLGLDAFLEHFTGTKNPNPGKKLPANKEEEFIKRFVAIFFRTPMPENPAKGFFALTIERTHIIFRERVLLIERLMPRNFIVEKNALSHFQP